MRAESTWPISGVNRSPCAGRGAQDLVYASVPTNDLLRHLLGVLLNACGWLPGRPPGTDHLLIGHREEDGSLFPRRGKETLSILKSLTELCITLFMRGTLSLHLGQSACCSNSSHSSYASHLPLRSFPGSTEAQNAVGSLRAYVCSLACWAGPLRLQAAGCRLQEGVLLAHPEHCGSGCRRQLWHLSSYSPRLRGGTHSASQQCRGVGALWVNFDRWQTVNSFTCPSISICSFWGCR